jgi:2-polyprenyl-3-methyl-5-hydroxy-6-metoxy-1,4-benzoquinol methylase
MSNIKQIWSSTNKGWRHIVKNMSEQKKDRIIKRVEKNLLSNELYESVESVLDWGCGGGLISKVLLEKGYHVYVVDLIQDSINSALEYAPKISYSQLINEDENKIKYLGPKPDVIFCNEVIQHFPSYNYFKKILDIWTKDINPKYISIQVKLGENTKSAQNYNENFLNGLIFNENDLIKDFEKQKYELISNEYSFTISNIKMGYYNFKKK